MGEGKLLNRQEWLKANGFIWDPFQSGAFRAETDPLLDLPGLPSYIDREDTARLVGDLDDPGPCYIFAKQGCGKSSLRKRIHFEYETSNSVHVKQKLLLIDYANHDYSLEEADYGHHIDRIIKLVEAVLTTNLHEERLALNQSPELALNKLVQTCRSHGFAGIYILVDKIEDTTGFIKIEPLIRRGIVSIDAGKFFIVKYFLAESLFLPVRSILLPGLFSPYVLVWNETELTQILNQRLLACLDPLISISEKNLISRFCEIFLASRVQSYLVKLGALANSPRLMWQLGHYLFEEYIFSHKFRYRSQNLIEHDVFERACNRFFDDLLGLDNSLLSYGYIDDDIKNREDSKVETKSPLREGEEETIDEKIFGMLQVKREGERQTKNEPVIFLCYAEKDNEKAKLLYYKLLQYGYKPWMGCYDILPGLARDEKTTSTLKNSNNFLILLSKNSYNQEGHLQKEIRIALDIWQTKLDNDPYLIPVRLEECLVQDNLMRFQHVDIYEDHGWDRLLLALEESKRIRLQQITGRHEKKTV